VITNTQIIPISISPQHQYKLGLKAISTSQMLPNNQHHNQHPISLIMIHATTKFSKPIS